MNNSFDTRFIYQTIKKNPYAETPAQDFFIEWCRINDWIVPQFIDRKEWKQKEKQIILEKGNQGNLNLFLPHDLQLWEMIDIIKTIDHDTFTNNPQKREEKVNQIQELWVVFEKTGLYLSEYLLILDKEHGRFIAEEMALQFYQYGLSLQNKKQNKDKIPQDHTLSQEDKTQLDEWFLWKDIYQKKIARLGKNPTQEAREKTRKKLLQVYFNALERVGYKAEGDKTWEIKVGPIQHLHDRTRRQITKAIEIPEKEMKTALFRRGVEKLVTEMKEVGWRKATNDLLKNSGFDPLLKQRKLYDILWIDKLKQELEEIRKTWDVNKVSEKELRIAKKIQQAVSSFPYKDQKWTDGTPNYPSEMVKNQFINCVGSSILGGGLLDKVGIKYLNAIIPKHSATVLITSDEKVYWQDFTPGNLKENYTEISPDMIKDEIDVSNVASNGITWHFKERNPYSQIKGNLKVQLFSPEIGLQCSVLNNAGNALINMGKNEEAIIAFKQAISIDPNYTYPFNGLGNALINLGKNEEAVIACKQAISMDPNYTYAYNRLGNALNNLGRYEEAIIAYQQAISIDPNSTYAYNWLGNTLNNLGRYSEAIIAYQQFIAWWNGDIYWINRAKNEITKLQQK